MIFLTTNGSVDFLEFTQKELYLFLIYNTHKATNWRHLSEYFLPCIPLCKVCYVSILDYPFIPVTCLGTSQNQNVNQIFRPHHFCLPYVTSHIDYIPFYDCLYSSMDFHCYWLHWLSNFHMKFRLVVSIVQLFLCSVKYLVILWSMPILECTLGTALHFRHFVAWFPNVQDASKQRTTVYRV